MTDEQAYMELVLCNTQSELHPLEEGKHAAESGMDLSLSSYALKLGKSNGFITQVTQAATVYREIFTRVKNFESKGLHRNLAEIHAAPQWLWTALVLKTMIQRNYHFNRKIS